MKQPVLLSLAWLTSSLGLYLALLILELDWNLYDWQPKLDLKASGLILGMFGLLVGVRFLAHASRDPFSSVVSLTACVALLALALYVLPAEPMTQGLFAREYSSPLWYRSARFCLLAIPSIFWALGLLRRRSSPDQTNSNA